MERGEHERDDADLDVEGLRQVEVDVSGHMIRSASKGREPAGHAEHEEEHGGVQQPGTRLGEHDAPAKRGPVLRHREVLDQLPDPERELHSQHQPEEEVPRPMDVPPAPHAPPARQGSHIRRVRRLVRLLLLQTGHLPRPHALRKDRAGQQQPVVHDLRARARASADERAQKGVSVRGVAGRMVQVVRGRVGRNLVVHPVEGRLELGVRDEPVVVVVEGVEERVDLGVVEVADVVVQRLVWPRSGAGIWVRTGGIRLGDLLVRAFLVHLLGQGAPPRRYEP